MDNLVLFIDLDGTLKTEHDDVGPYEEPSITVQSGAKTYVLAARPHVHTFLEEASRAAKKVVLCTAGGGGYARRVISAMGIEKYFTDIIAAEDFKYTFPIKTDWKCIFIDNSREMVDLKVERISQNRLYASSRYIPKETWVIDTYHGSKDDKTMLELAEEIKKL